MDTCGDPPLARSWPAGIISMHHQSQALTTKHSSSQCQWDSVGFCAVQSTFMCDLNYFSSIGLNRNVKKKKSCISTYEWI